MSAEIIFIILVYFFSIVLHEVAHGFAAYSLGDPTAKDSGRLTLNPIPHVDPVGTIFLPLLAIVFRSPILFGWAKPVPYNPMYFKNIRQGTFLVAIAGVGTNLLLALVFGLLIRFGLDPLASASSATFSGNIAVIFRWIVWANLVLGIFNLFPIPPLDGSKILLALLPHEAAERFMAFERYGIIVLLLVLLWAPGLVGGLASAAFSLIVGQPFF